FWWLHNLTKVDFVRSNSAFRLMVRIRPSDYTEFAPIVQSIYLDRFRTKNAETVQILKDHGYPVILDADGGVIQLRAVPRLPEPIRQALHALAASPATHGDRPPPGSSTDSSAVAAPLPNDPEEQEPARAGVDELFDRDPVVGFG